MNSQEILPPASILEKLKKRDPALVDEVMTRAKNYPMEPAPAFSLKHRFQLMAQGAMSVFGGSAKLSGRPTIDPAVTLSIAWKNTGNKLRRAISEIVDENDIRLTQQEKNALEPI